MRIGMRRSLAVAVVVGLVAMVGCGGRAPAKPEPAAVATPLFEETPIPTVPPRTATPEVTPRPTPLGQVYDPMRPIGPVITHFGVARADGLIVDPASVGKDGVPTYTTAAGSGFILVVEARPGDSGLDVARQVFMYAEDDPRLRPDLEIQANRDLGDGSKRVCDRRKPVIGGIPGINPPSFAETQAVADALNDFSCRFENFIESDSSCTVDKLGNYSFAKPETTMQFCTIVARSFLFPEGITELQVRVRDSGGNPGPIKKLRISRAPSKKPKN